MTQINIASISEGGPGRKYGTLKSREGATYMLPVGMNGVFQPGTTVDVPVKQETWKDRKTGQEELKHIINGRPGGTGSGVGAPSAPQASAPPRPATNGARMIGQCDKDVLITATALMKSFIETGQFGLTDLETLMKACVPAARLMVKAASGTPGRTPDHAGTFTGGDQ